MEIRVDGQNAGRRLDSFIHQKYPHLSRSKVQKIIKKGLLWVDDRQEKTSYKIRPGDKISFSIPKEEALSLEPEEIPLEIIYEDEHLLLINKPAGLVVHPAVGNKRGTVLNAVLGYLKDKDGCQNVERAGIVHRLDKETSGLMVVAKDEQSFSFLQSQFKQRKVEKKYQVLVWGKLKEKEGIIDAPIGRSQSNRKRMAVAEEGRSAQTKFKLIREYRSKDDQALSLLEVEPKTGRTHQIRVHLRTLGHPVVGDKVYGKKNDLDKTLNRQFLHAFYLKFKHPQKEKFLEFEIKLAPELEGFLSRII